MRKFASVGKLAIVGLLVLCSPACTEHKRLASETVIMRQKIDEEEQKFKDLNDEYRILADNLNALKADPSLKHSGKTTPEDRAKKLQIEIDSLTSQKADAEKALAVLKEDFETYKKAN
ncbi:hypothetical protein [Verrucomicrobium sp. BvORR034]|uniref:hypothetical protein n=1 Tax=Verrucomicrobium sp. BvORR034 TaxID=1396418 RepID=UPI002240FDDB|nr:hypothetical protein [Verrucomicrobium sp. BvORR034]